MGIRGQLLIVLALTALVIAAAAYSGFRWQTQTYTADFRQRQVHLLEAIGVPVAVLVAQNDNGTLDTLVAEFSHSLEDSELTELSVYDRQGRVLADTHPERFNTLVEDVFVKRAVQSEEAQWKLEDDGTLRIAVPARSGVKWATVVGHFSMRFPTRNARMEAAVWSIGAVLLLSLIAAALYFSIGLLVARPLRRLRQTVRAMSEGNLDARASAEGVSELSELGSTVNRMAEALQRERENLESVVSARTLALVQANEALEKASVTDGLTGLFNYRRFHEDLNAELKRAERHNEVFSMLMLDVDYFKRVNDLKGHPTGDEVLRQVAAVVKEALRQTDIVARYGGEEFAAILPRTGKAEASLVAERVRVAVAHQLASPERYGQAVTVSIGLATFPEDALGTETLLAAADRALYIAKNAGRNRLAAAS